MGEADVGGACLLPSSRFQGPLQPPSCVPSTLLPIYPSNEVFLSNQYPACVLLKRDVEKAQGSACFPDISQGPGRGQTPSQ